VENTAGIDVKWETQQARNYFEEHVVKKQKPSLKELLDRENIVEDELPQYCEGIIQNIVDYSRENHYSFGDELTKEIDFLYRCFLATRELGTHHPLTDFSKSLDSFDSFRERYLPNESKRTNSSIMTRLTRFRGCIIHPNGSIDVYQDGVNYWKEEGIYSFAGEWIVLEKGWRGRYELIKKDVVPEAVKLKKNKPSYQLTHSTGSAAFDSIAESRALLSARKLLTQKKSVKTGEFVTYMTDRDVSLTGGKHGLPQIKGQVGIQRGYGIARWFDEYYGTFVIDLEKQREHIKILEEKTDIDTDPVRFFSEGLDIGSEVPLENVTHLVVDHINLDEARTWVKKNCPHMAVTSYDAFSLWRESERGEIDLHKLLKAPSFTVNEKGELVD